MKEIYTDTGFSQTSTNTDNEDVWGDTYTGETSGGMPYFSTNQFPIEKNNMNAYTYVSTLLRFISIKPLVRDILSIVKWIAVAKILFIL
tara:strand:+ start:2252 stop:2518 length:267 start_codon:yes stop_codon:yes gene_type:complete